MADMLRKPEKQKTCTLSSVVVLEETVDWIKEICDMHICEKQIVVLLERLYHLQEIGMLQQEEDETKKYFEAANVGFLLLNVIFVASNILINFIYIMKKSILLLFILFCLSCIIPVVRAADTIFIRETQVPVLIERVDNVLFYLRLDAKESTMLNRVILNFREDTNLSDIQSVKLYYSGTEALQDRNKGRFAPVEYISSHTAGKTLAANPSYSIKKAEVIRLQKRLILDANQSLFPGINFFWVSLQMKPETSLDAKVRAAIASVTLDGKEAPLNVVSPQNIEHRMGGGGTSCRR